MDKHHPLKLIIFKERKKQYGDESWDEVVYGILICEKCMRWYPIDDEIPIMLPDDLREKEKDITFLRKWKEKIPERVLEEGQPHHL